MKTGDFRKSKIILLGLVLSGATSSCGNSGPEASVEKVNPASYNGNTTSNSVTAAASSSSIPGQYECPTSNNVIPNYDVHFNGTDYFMVCPSVKAKSDILIHGTTYSSNTICVFPIQYNSYNNIYPFTDTTTGLPAVQCVQAATSGAFVSFPGLSYNAVMIVEQPSEAQLSSCLSADNFYACPFYSFGQFR